MKKKLIVIMIAVAAAFNLSSCKNGKENQKETIITIAQNDYAGAYQRLTILQNNILEKMQILENHNYEIMEGNPEDYWADDGFYFLNFLPVYNENLQHTSVLNEIDNFADIQAYMAEYFESLGYTCKVVLRREANNYKLEYTGNFVNIVTWREEYGDMTLDCLYDPSTNRMRVESSLVIGSYTISDFYEFAEIEKGRYAVQNGKERLYVEYDDQGELSSFCYSALPDAEAVNISSNMEQEEYSALKSTYGFDGNVFPVLTEDNLYAVYFSNGDILYFQKDEAANRYTQADASVMSGKDIMKASACGYYDRDADSIYKNIQNINEKWVYQAGAFSETVSCDDGVISVMTTNVLTKEEKEFTVKEKASDTTEE